MVCEGITALLGGDLSGQGEFQFRDVDITHVADTAAQGTPFANRQFGGHQLGDDVRLGRWNGRRIHRDLGGEAGFAVGVASVV
jgi:hypothetical protein